LIEINAERRLAIMDGTRARIGAGGPGRASQRGLGYSRMPLFIYRCPNSGYRVQGFVPEDISEDDHVYEPVTCPVCHQIHHVNPHTGVVLGEKAK
jgi:hypothetical protein